MVRRIIRWGGIAIPSAQPVVNLTDLDRAFANIPGLHTLIDPAYRVGINPRNLAGENDVLQNATTSGPAVGAFPNGAPAFSMTDANTAQFVGSVDQDPATWSILAVHRLNARQEGSGHMLINANVDTGNDATIARVGFFGPATSARAWASGNQGDSNPILTYVPPTSFVGRTAVSMFTYSGGMLRYFENGIQRANVPSADLTNRYRAGQWALLRFVRGLIGNVAVFSSDLSQPAMAGHRNRAIAFLMQKYGVM